MNDMLALHVRVYAARKRERRRARAEGSRQCAGSCGREANRMYDASRYVILITT